MGDERWAEHFKEILNRPPPPEPPEIPDAGETLEVNMNPPTKAEIRKAIKTMKSGKAAGPDGIPPEALKDDINTSTDMLHPFLQKVWENEEMPMEWKKGYLVKLPKKGDLSSCGNWRGITLLSIPGKILSRIILERLRTTLDQKLRDEQAGFRQRKSCTDQIASLRIIIEQSLEWQTSLYMTFVDFQKAFDSVDREVIWKLMQYYGIPHKFINIIRRLYENSTCQVIHDGKLTDPFKVETGSVLLYGSETWGTTKTNTTKLQTFINRCLKYIFKVRWPQTISNEELWRRTEQTPIDIQIKKRKWGLIGHTLRKPPTDITRQSLEWNPQGKRKVGRPKQTWRRSMKAEIRSAGRTELKRDAQNRVRWRGVALALFSSGDPEA
ncbi:hypothetical protein EGW08_020580 [Elysia chlorotica]|uniref:Reverse transcriptase domain-containing protein n=1 Tax=Elysia chlorotica TaxID=188477 RepID=A0A3S0Z6D2_ELYCH|nr:hypothetical protein EGW08_020580 [Elysia chlorotica]